MPVEKYRLAAGTAALLLAVSITACKATDRGSADSSGTEGSTVSGSTTAAAGTAVSAADIDGDDGVYSSLVNIDNFAF